MIQIGEFIKAGGGFTDHQLSAMIKEKIEILPHV